MAIQSKGSHDYREIIPLKNNGNLAFCVSTDLFISVVEEGITQVDLNEKAWVVLKTSDGEYKLPCLRQRGLFMVEPEISLPGEIKPEEEPPEVWEDDYSSKTINTKGISGGNLSAMLVVIGKNMVARSIFATLEQYGEGDNARVSISPDQYSLIQKLGKISIKCWKKDYLQAVNEEGTEVRIRNAKPKLDLSSIENNLGNYITEFKLPSSQTRAISKFTTEKIILVLKNGSISLVTQSARKTFEQKLEIKDPLNLLVLSKDMKYLTGEVTVFNYMVRGKQMYMLRSNDKDKKTFLLVQPVEGGVENIKW